MIIYAWPMSEEKWVWEVEDDDCTVLATGFADSEWAAELEGQRARKRLMSAKD